MGKEILDITGQRFGRLLAVRRLEKDKWGNTVWLCKCDCQKEIVTQLTALRSKRTKSCGCLRREVRYRDWGKHRKEYSAQYYLANRREIKECVRRYRTAHREQINKRIRESGYAAWANIIQRCFNPNRDTYRFYGGRGITVCDRWRKFENFLKDMGPRPEGTHIHRIDSNGDYSPDNCVWLDKTEHARLHYQINRGFKSYRNKGANPNYRRYAADDRLVEAA